MSFFDAINHAMSAISTGGFSTSDQSIAKWTEPSVHWTLILIMITGSLPFALYAIAWRGSVKELINDNQVHGFIGILFFTWFIFTIWYKYNNLETTWLDALRFVAFNVTSIISTTGLTLNSYDQWGSFSIMLFFYLGFIGGCSGSTSGGIKIFRFQVAFILLKASLYQLIHPRAIVKQHYNHHPLDEEIVRSILTFSFFFGGTIGILALGLSLLGIDWMTALTAAASNVSGVGPGLGPIVGPSGNYASLPDTAKWLLSLGMLFGRLEIITILIIFTPIFWRN